MERTIFHIDVNSAYLSWSAVRMLAEGYPVDIRNIPSIIGGDRESRHGIVLAKSVPAKKYHIHTGEPVASALKKCPDLQIFPAQMKYYKEQSKKFVSILLEYTPDIEQVSVDECYVDVTSIMHNWESAEKLAYDIKDNIRIRLGFTVNVGISDKKVLAKMASDFLKPDRVHTLYTDEIQKKMWRLPIGDLFMAGRSSVSTLQKLGINTIGELAQTPQKIIEAHLKKHGKILWEYANGIDDTPVNINPEEQKGVGNSVTLPKDLTTVQEVNHTLLELAEKVSGRLRAANQRAGMVSLEIKYNDFSKISHQTTLSVPTNSSQDIYNISCKLFGAIWNDTPIRLLGIRTSKLVSENEPEQLNIFDVYSEKNEKTRQKMRKLDEAMDKIREKYGKDAVSRASLLDRKEDENELKSK